MQIALIGYGKMGHAIESLALEQGHRIVATIDNPTQWTSNSEALYKADVAIEFSTPTSAAHNLAQCFDLGLPVVCGTTGWDTHRNQVAQHCLRKQGALFVASNFSIGMNIMFYLNRRLASVMQDHEEYRASISETHHIHKLDAPSGTALTLQRDLHQILPQQQAPITSIREGEVPGTHVVSYTSDIDTLTLTHCAHSRRGLAQGALAAAQFLIGKKGIFGMNDLLNLPE